MRTNRRAHFWMKCRYIECLLEKHGWEKTVYRTWFPGDKVILLIVEYNMAQTPCSNKQTYKANTRSRHKQVTTTEIEAQREEIQWERGEKQKLLMLYFTLSALTFFLLMPVLLWCPAGDVMTPKFLNIYTGKTSVPIDHLSVFAEYKDGQMELSIR